MPILRSRLLAAIPAAATLLLAAVPSAAQQVAVTIDMPYANAEPAASQGHLLNLYVPVGSRTPLPVVLWVRGSGWMEESGRDGADALAARLNPRGYAVVGVAIRSSGHAQFPAQVHDIKAAIRWVRANAREHNLDPNRIAIAGDSSGGWTALMAGLTADVPGLEGRRGVLGRRSDVQAVVAFYPPTDLSKMDETSVKPCGPEHPGGMQDDVFCHGGPRSPESLLLGCELRNCPERAVPANPVTHVGRGEPPVLLLHGIPDPLVPYNQSELVYDALRAACNDVTFVTYPHAGHGVWQEMLGDPATTRDATVKSSSGCNDVATTAIRPTWEMLVGFLDRHLGN